MAKLPLINPENKGMPVVVTSLDRIFQRSQERVGEYVPAQKANPYFDKYAHRQNPIGDFVKEVLHTNVTPDINAMYEAMWHNRTTIARSGNSTGKSHGSAQAIIAIAKILQFHGVKIFTFAAPPEDNLKKNLWGQIAAIIDKHPHLFTNCKVSLASLHIELAPDEFIDGLSIPVAGTDATRRAKFSGKHAPYNWFFGDEADGVPNVIYAAIESCLTGGLMQRLVLMFNPRHQSGPVYLKEKNRQGKVLVLSALTHPNVITGEHIYPGAVDRDVTLQRINEWTRVPTPKELSTLEPKETFIPPDYLVGTVAPKPDKVIDEYGIEKSIFYSPLPSGPRVIVEPDFYHMVLAEYPAQSLKQLINRADIDRAVSRWQAYVTRVGEVPPRGIKPVLGQDVGELGQDMSQCCPRYGSYVGRLIGWKGTDTDVTATMCTDVIFDTNARVINVDGTGVGAGVWPQIRKELVTRGRGGVTEVNRVMMSKTVDPDQFSDPIGNFRHLRDCLAFHVKRWLEKDPEAMLPPDEDLIEELTTADYHVDGDKIIVMSSKTFRELTHRSPDRFTALMLTFYTEEMDGKNAPGELQTYNYLTGSGYNTVERSTRPLGVVRHGR